MDNKSNEPSENNNNEELEKIKNSFLEFLDDLNEKVLDNKMTDKARLDNINFYNNILKISDDNNALKNFFNRYKLVRKINSQSELSLYFKNENHKKDIICWKHLFYTNFLWKDQSWQLYFERIFIYEKENSLWEFREKVKKLIDDFIYLPSPSNSTN